MKELFTLAKTHTEDLKLFYNLKFKAFEFNDQKEHYIGKHKIPHYKKAKIKIYVTCMPAQFWRFEITTDEDKKYEISTGSGLLSNYFKTAIMVAEGMLTIKEIKS